MKNQACTDYGSVPERLCVIQNGQVVYLQDVGPDGYSVKALESWIKDYLKKK